MTSELLARLARSRTGLVSSLEEQAHKLSSQQQDVALSLVARTRKAIERLKGPPAGSQWESYYNAEVSSEKLATKRAKLDSILGAEPSSTVLDLGCNTGEFSKLAAAHGHKVIAVDGDASCIDRLYADCRRDSLNILPVVMNLSLPTPPVTYPSLRLSGAEERLRSPIVLALGLMHHLRITGALTFDGITELLAGFCEKLLIFEYVDFSDGNVARLAHQNLEKWSREEVIAALERRFSITFSPSDRPTRELFICNRK